MLQLKALNGRLLAEYAAGEGFPPRWTSMAELERAADDWVARLRRDRARLAAESPGLLGRLKLFGLRAFVDRKLRTDRVEFFDRADTGESTKATLASELHLVNRILGAYTAFLSALKPHIERVHKREGRPARVLELACGSGEFTLELAARARDQGLPVVVTGSDIQPRYVEDGNARARERGLDGGARFVRVNAFDMGDIETGAHDIVFIAQSIHHFTPGQIAMMIGQSRRVARDGFIGIDGYRSLSVLLMTNLVGMLPLRLGPRVAYMMWHDAVTSGRKFLPAAELELIARIAAAPRGDVVRTWRTLPYHTVLEVVPRGPGA